MAQLAARRRGLWVLILDFVDTYFAVALRQEERRFCTANLEEDGHLVMRCMGFGGNAFPNVYCRIAS